MSDGSLKPQEVVGGEAGADRGAGVSPLFTEHVRVETGTDLRPAAVRSHALGY